MPGVCEKIRKYLGLDQYNWNMIEIKSNIKLENIEPLFTRIDK